MILLSSALIFSTSPALMDSLLIGEKRLLFGEIRSLDAPGLDRPESAYA